MEGKNTGAVVFILLFITMCAIVGSCFMAFIFPNKQIKVADPQIIVADGILVRDAEGQQIQTLKLSTSKVGLKPVTGEEDDVFSIPITVTDTQGSEGLYGKFYVESNINWKLVLTDIRIDDENASLERKHIKVGLKNVKDSSQTLENDDIIIATEEASLQTKEYTFYVWLHPSAGDELIGKTISFKLNFEDNITE